MEIEGLFDAAARRMAGEHADVERGRIMHSEGIKTGDRFFAFVRRDELVVKVPADRVAELIAGGAGRPFDAGRGRPMKEWVCLRPADGAACHSYMDEARRFVSGLR